MKLAILIEDEFGNPPPNVKIVQEFCGMFDPHTYVRDEHGRIHKGIGAIIEGEPQAICDWLHPHSPVWSYVGSPMMEQFELLPVKRIAGE